MKLIDLNPKYKELELMLTQGKTGDDVLYGIINVEAFDLKDAVVKYGNCEVLSTRDYDDTRTTSVILLAGGRK